MKNQEKQLLHCAHCRKGIGPTDQVCWYKGKVYCAQCADDEGGLTTLGPNAAKKKRTIPTFLLGMIILAIIRGFMIISRQMPSGIPDHSMMTAPAKAPSQPTPTLTPKPCAVTVKCDT